MSQNEEFLQMKSRALEMVRVALEWKALVLAKGLERVLPGQPRVVA
jgi:hypothetical protein